jgi:uncharacterized damage-inducible protein DinB
MQARSGPNYVEEPAERSTKKVTSTATSNISTRPESDEFASYYAKYIELVPSASIVSTLREQQTGTAEFISTLTDDQGNSRYEPGKWSVKEVIGHIIDCERIFAYRALRFARNDKVELSGFEQDGYVENGAFDDRTMSDLAQEYSHVRSATLHLLEHLTDEAWSRRGVANGNEVSVRAIAWIIGGHELHHVSGIRSNYLK